ncbi:hypothetical protein MMC34_004734 [Xylographa carneopallida]|nr:hypothetical protein [Xylographa carneopallida]
MALMRDMNVALGFKDRKKEQWIKRWLAVLKKKTQNISKSFSKPTRTLTGLIEDGTQDTRNSSPSTKQNAATSIQGLQCTTGNAESDSSDSLSPQTSPSHKHCWIITHGFYAVTGGFAIDTDSEGPSFVHGPQNRLTFSVEGLRFIARNNQDLLADISERKIQDKSKANGLAKFLVCIQALWFCIQCISRLAQGLPISLLEVNTAVHAICTLLIYMLWWSKPLDVEEPTLLEGSKSWTLVAWMWMTGIETEGEYWTRLKTDVTFEDPALSSQDPLEVGPDVNGDDFQSLPRCSQPDQQDLMTSQKSFPFTGSVELGALLTNIHRYPRSHDANDKHNLRSTVSVYDEGRDTLGIPPLRTRSLRRYRVGGRKTILSQTRKNEMAAEHRWVRTICENAYGGTCQLGWGQAIQICRIADTTASNLLPGFIARNRAPYTKLASHMEKFNSGP